MDIDPFRQSVSEFFERLSSEPRSVLLVFTFVVALAAVLGDWRHEQESKREYKKFIDDFDKLDKLHNVRENRNE